MDEQLRELIAEVLKHPPQSPERQKALNRLLIKLQQLPGLRRSSHLNYLEALNKTWEWVSNNIQKFSSRPPSVQVSLEKWINGYLYWRIKDLYTQDDPAIRSLDEIVGSDREGSTYMDRLSEEGFNPATLVGIEAHIEKSQKQEKQRIGLELELYIEKDQARKLQNCYPRNHPQCNCRILSLKLILKDPIDSYAELARELNVNRQTLVSHWQRKCLPLLQGVARSRGYQPE